MKYYVKNENEKYIDVNNLDPSKIELVNKSMSDIQYYDCDYKKVSFKNLPTVVQQQLYGSRSKASSTQIN